MHPPSVPVNDRPAGPAGGLPSGVPASYALPDAGPNRLLDDAVRDFPDGIAVRAGEVGMTWAELDAAVNDVAAGLHAAGVGGGTVVAVPGWGDVRDVVAPLAVWRCRGVVAVAGTDDPDERWRSTADVVLVDPREDRSGATADGPHTLGLGVDVRRVRQGAWWRPWRRESVATVVVSSGGDPVDPGDAERGASDTGEAATVRPTTLLTVVDGALVEVPTRSLVATAFALRLWVPDVQAGEEVMLLRGLAHRDVALVLLPSLLAAATVVVDDGDDEVVATAVANGVTMLVADGPALAGSASADSGTALRVVLHHGPLEPDVGLDLRTRTGARVCEIDGVAAANHLTHAQPVYGRTGPDGPDLPVTNTRVCVTDADGHEVAPGEVGRLWVAGPQVLADGWLDTGTDVRRGPEGGLAHAS